MALAHAEAPDASPSRGRNVTRLVVATSLGNALEWFDISVYAYFAVYLSKAFFPNSNQTTSLLLTFGSFALTFRARPIGGVLLGTYADRHGRKASLLLSILMMTFGTLAVAGMPTFAQIGLGLSYNIGVTAFGGSGPAIATWLGSFALIGDLAPGHYLTAVCLFSLWALTTIRRKSADGYT